MKSKTLFEMDYNEFDTLVRNHMRATDFESVAEFEWCNDQSISFNNVTNGPRYEIYTTSTPKHDIEQWFTNDIRAVDEWIVTRKQFSTGPAQMLQWLCYHGHIEPGNYLITVSW